MRMILILCWLSVGCAAPTAVRMRPGMPAGPLGSDAHCAALVERRDGVLLAAKVVAGVGGVSAFGAAPESMPDAGRWGFAAGAASLSAVAVALAWYGDAKAAEFERYCEVTP